jgi:hypothetical protein
MAVKRMLRAIQGAVAVCALISVSALAQTDGSAISFYQEQGQLIRGSRGVTALGDQLFGDKVDLYTGAPSFSQTDISLPGHGSLAPTFCPSPCSTAPPPSPCLIERGHGASPWGQQVFQ